MRFISLFLITLTFSLSIFSQDNLDGKQHIINDLIDPNIEIQARYDMWNNPNADFFFLNSFEMKEDYIGLHNIQMAIKNARAGKTVHVVLDPAGSFLSEETLYHMVKEGVQVHEYSKMFSWTNIKDRINTAYAANKLNKFNPIIYLQAVWRNLTYRSHNKLFLIDKLGDESFDPTDNLSPKQHINGGRNMGDSYFNVDIENKKAVQENFIYVEENGKKTKIVKNDLLPQSEYEHGVLTKSQNAHNDEKAFIKGLLEGDHTERIKLEDLEKRRIKSRAARMKYLNAEGGFWKSKFIYENLRNETNFLSFKDDIADFMINYNLAWDPTDGMTYEEGVEQAKKLREIFIKHESGLIDLIDNGKISPDFLAKNFSGIMDSSQVKLLKRAAAQVKSGKIGAKSLLEGVIGILEIGDVGGALTDDGINKLAHFQRFMGPFSDKKTFSQKLANYWSKLFGITFDEAKLTSIKKQAETATDFLVKKHGLKLEGIDWMKSATYADAVQSMNDLVKDSSFKKKIMDYAWDSIKGGEKVWIVSQYGTPTKEAMEAFDDLLKGNSAAHRLVEQFANKGGVGTDKVATGQFIDKLTELFEANELKIRDGLIGNLGSSGNGTPVRKIQNVTRNRVFLQAMIDILDATGDDKFLLQVVQTELENGRKTADEVTSILIDSIKRNRQVMIESLMKNHDKFSKAVRRLRHYVDDDPKEILGKHTPRELHFATNDDGAWRLGADPYIIDDSHLVNETRFSTLGKGTNTYGFNYTGETVHSRIHAKTVVVKKPNGGYEVLIWSANFDYRSSDLNGENGIKLIFNPDNTEFPEKIIKNMEEEIFSKSVKYLKNGTFIKDTHCPLLLKRMFIRNLARKLL